MKHCPYNFDNFHQYLYERPGVSLKMESGTGEKNLKKIDCPLSNWLNYEANGHQKFITPHQRYSKQCPFHSTENILV